MSQLEYSSHDWVQLSTLMCKVTLLRNVSALICIIGMIERGVCITYYELLKLETLVHGWYDCL